MGSLLCCNNNTEEETQNIVSKPVEYSWNQKKKLDPKDYTIENCNDSCVGRLPGTINGEQFIIQNCKKTRIYLLDYIGTITVDDCSDCDIIIGPVKTSFFIRDCIKCNIMVACQQFRTRDCRNLNAFLSCTSQPIIESTSKFKVGSYQLYYPELSEQFNKANLSPFNCIWSDVYDFTPVTEQGSNFSFLPEETKPFDLISPPASILNTSAARNYGDSINSENEFVNFLMKMEITDSRCHSVVPYTLGNRRNLTNDGSFQIPSLILLFYNKGEERKLAHDLIKYMITNFKNIHLIRTRENKVSLETAKRLINPKITENDSVMKGPIISLEYYGSTTINDCVTSFKETQLSIPDLNNLIYVPPDTETSKAQIEILNNVINMYMNTTPR